MPESCCLRAIPRVLEDNGVNHISWDLSGRMNIRCTAAFTFTLSSGYVFYSSASWLKKPSAWLVRWFGCWVAVRSVRWLLLWIAVLWCAKEPWGAWEQQHFRAREQCIFTVMDTLLKTLEAENQQTAFLIALLQHVSCFFGLFCNLHE